MVEQWPLFAPIVAYILLAFLIVIFGRIAFKKEEKQERNIITNI